MFFRLFCLEICLPLNDIPLYTFCGVAYSDQLDQGLLRIYNDCLHKGTCQLLGNSVVPSTYMKQTTPIDALYCDCTSWLGSISSPKAQACSPRPKLRKPAWDACLLAHSSRKLQRSCPWRSRPHLSHQLLELSQ